ncbi:hypothetical protein [Streptomyces anthocyanicus]|uniref:hypothetical protein n=1 Tax=Streptomyces anthocyanicus TaxID=68174 RepID=UPI00380C3BDA
MTDQTTASCPTPETHNWGCGCPSDEHPAALGTLPAWLYQRFMAHGVGWDQLDEDDRSYWEHQARAVRRAVARGGFKQPAIGAQQDETAATETQPPATVTIEMLAGALAAHTDLLIGALGEGVASIAVVPTETAGMRRVIDLLKLHKSRLLNLQQHADLIRRLGPFLAAFEEQPAAGARQDGAQP